MEKPTKINQNGRAFFSREMFFDYKLFLKDIFGVRNSSRRQSNGFVQKLQLYLVRHLNFHLGVHYFVFVPALMNLGTQKQQEQWLQKSLNAEIIGTYAQTELGHGTFLTGLETTSTYDPKTKEFVIHSPSITAYKV